MKKKNETATLEAPKVFTETYMHLYKGENWPIQVTFSNEIINLPAPHDRFNGMYYIEGHNCNQEVGYHFQGEVLNNFYNRKKFNDEWIKSKIFNEAARPVISE